MTPTAPLKKSSYMKELIAQADPPKDANTVKKGMTSRYSSLQIKRGTILKNGRLQVKFWKKVFYLYKNLMLQIDPLSSSYSQKLQYPQITTIAVVKLSN